VGGWVSGWVVWVADPGGGKGAVAGDGVAVGVFPRCEADFDGREEYPVCARVSRAILCPASHPPSPPPCTYLLAAESRALRRVLMKKGSRRWM